VTGGMRQRRGELGTAGLTIGLLVLGGALLPYALTLPEPATATAVVLRWWHLVPMFALAEMLVFHLEVKSDAHTFSLSEVPFVLALIFTSPAELIIARLAGEALVLVVRERQAVVKLAFNLSLFVAESCLALTVFHATGGQARTGAVAWGLAAVAVLVAGLFGALSVWTVIRVHQGHSELSPVLATAAVTASGNACLAGITTALLDDRRWALIPLLLVAALLVAGYRGYARLVRRYAGLEILYQFTRLTSEAMRPEQAITTVLDEARRLLRTESAVLTLSPGPGGEPGTTVSSPPGACATALPEAVRRRVTGELETVVIPRGTEDRHQREVLDAVEARDLLVAPLVSGGSLIGTLLVADRLGDVSTFDDEDARLFSTLAAQAGITLDNGLLIERLHEQARAREHDALHDSLTGLPNRLLFSRSLDEALARFKDGGAPFGVLLADLDQFKEVNDALGHHIGDALLDEVASRLRVASAGRGLVARLGGDEFAVLLEDVEDASDVLEFAATLHTQVTAPIRLASLLLEVGASIGVALCPDDGKDSAILLQRADVAMYAAKRARERVVRFDAECHGSSPLHLKLAGEIRGALENRRIEVYYQPIARVRDRTVVTAEALVRWHHPELGDLPPEDFVPIAERSGLIGQLTYYVLDHALAQCRAWRMSGMDLKVAVNLSAQVLLDVEWPAKVLALLRHNGVRPEALTFEITETQIMSDPEHMIAVLNELAKAGVTFSVDDFGTGYSSLSYLQRLPVHEVKIDKSFVLPLASDLSAAAIVQAVVDLARNLDLEIIAEGVEDDQTAGCLAHMDCDLFQGYHLSRPLPPAEFTAWLRRHLVLRLAG
jgi:diguanylate cyclase (GGDEF)-like protein